MSRVIDEIRRRMEESTVVADDIVEIRAVRFIGASSQEDALRIIGDEGRLSRARLERINVALTGQRPDGTHSYLVNTFDKTEYCWPIW